MSLKGKNKIFYRTPDVGSQYKWSPDNFNKKINPKKIRIKKRKDCTALPNTQGEDFNTGYVYKLVVSGEEHRYAYVACDYVE